jgi:hypothetical protein
MRPADAPPSKISTRTTASFTFRTAPSLDTTHSTNSPGNYVRRIPILSIHPMERPRRYTTRESLHGARARKASRPRTPGSMLSFFVRARSPSCMSFSIRNCPLPNTTRRPPDTWPSCVATCRSESSGRIRQQQRLGGRNPSFLRWTNSSSARRHCKSLTG